MVLGDFGERGQGGSSILCHYVYPSPGPEEEFAFKGLQHGDEWSGCAIKLFTS